MSIGTFSAPTRIVTGQGSLDRLGAELATLPSPTVVVADQGLADAGLLAEILGRVDTSRIGATTLVAPDPNIATVEAAAAAAGSAGCASVLAIGGGSGLGAAKAVAIMLTNPGPVTAYEGTGRVPNPPAPVLAVPTTAGSGSEVSNALVLHEPGRAREIIVRGPGCEPCIAVLDATVLRRLPHHPMLYAGLDALTHALEALWVKETTVFTEALAVRAAREIFEVLPVAVAGTAPSAPSRNADRANDAALQRLLEASTAANLACGNSGLGLVHALSASVQVELPHGLQNGVLLPSVAELNRPAVSPAAIDLIDHLPALYEALEFRPLFDGDAVGDRQIESMISASTGHPFRINNRVDFTDDQLRELLARSVGPSEEALQ